MAFAKLKTYRNESQTKANQNRTKPNQLEPVRIEGGSQQAAGKRNRNEQVNIMDIAAQRGTDSILYTGVYSIYTAVHAV